MYSNGNLKFASELIDFASAFLSSDSVPGQGVSPVPPLLEYKRIKDTRDISGAFDGLNRGVEWGCNDDDERYSIFDDQKNLSAPGAYGEPRYKHVSVARKGCKSWSCPRCAKRKGYRLRKALIKKVHLFPQPRLLTITVDRKWHESAEQAYKYVMSNKLISRLMRHLKIDVYFWVMEYQGKSGEGWPHWHILVDVSKLPTKYYNRDTKEISSYDCGAGFVRIPYYLGIDGANRLLRAWKVSKYCHLSNKHLSFACPEHAINYITKYLTKGAEFVPEWALKLNGIRQYNVSVKLGSLSCAADSVACDDDDDDDENVVEAIACEAKNDCEDGISRFDVTKSMVPADRIAECDFKFSLFGILPDGSAEYIGEFLYPERSFCPDFGFHETINVEHGYKYWIFTLQDTLDNFLLNCINQRYLVRKAIHFTKIKLLQSWDNKTCSCA